ncbi:ABC transporter I family member 11, chloroplastic isoform X1 [Cryptomeria japonica]|uniref:ABC transporter I family member 11, chloroplastic isoform X1 n=1 Tax=Cryptomeria japonica TaxID=3369 RepID=UPI0025AD4D10|nr:ABC transporter I family member 11, chloroplastic isoform X1 [Cryptomeria japonica]
MMTMSIVHLGPDICSCTSIFQGKRLKKLSRYHRLDNYLLTLSRRNRIRVSSEHTCLEVQGVSYRVPGTQHNLLNRVSFSLPEKSLGLIYGRSGSGKTTLLQVLSGLAKPTAGSICLKKKRLDGQSNESEEILSASKVGLVFQFPERYFLADTVAGELTFGFKKRLEDQFFMQQFRMRLESAILAVGLNGIALDLDPRSLSDGFKRRLALAVQLVRMPDILLLDEPLAGLDWKARADVVKLLENLKKDIMLIVVSHDLKEISRLVDKAWRMEMGGFLIEEPLSISN